MVVISYPPTSHFATLLTVFRTYIQKSPLQLQTINKMNS